MKCKKCVCDGDQPKARRGCTLDYYEDKIYLFSGIKAAKENIIETWYYCINSNKWNPIPNQDTQPSARAFHSSVLYKDSIIIFGGKCVTTYDTKRTNFNDVYIFNLTNHKWKLIQCDNKPITRHKQGIYNNIYPF